MLFHSISTERINKPNLKAVHQVLSHVADVFVKRPAAKEMLLALAADLESELIIREAFDARTIGERQVQLPSLERVKWYELQVLAEYFENGKERFSDLNPSVSEYWESLRELCLSYLKDHWSLVE